jgi:hypothetical protein
MDSINEKPEAKRRRGDPATGITAGLSNRSATLCGGFSTSSAQRFIRLLTACVLVACAVVGQMITLLSRAIFALVSRLVDRCSCDRRDRASVHFPLCG